MKLGYDHWTIKTQDEIDWDRTPDVSRDWFEEQKQIWIEDVGLTTTDMGLLLLDLSTPRHKYLKFHFGSWSSWDRLPAEGEPEREHAYSYGLQMTTYDQVWDRELDFATDLAQVDIWLVPETEQEERFLSGSRIVVQRLEYRHQVLFVPGAQFWCEGEYINKGPWSENRIWRYDTDLIRFGNRH